MSQQQFRVPHLPATTIKARALSWGLSEAKSGNEQLAVTFQITADGEHKGKTISDYLSFTERTIDTSIKAMNAMGWDGGDLAAGPPKGLDTNEVLLVIEHEDETDDKGVKTGHRRSRVRWVNGIGVTITKPLEGQKLASFATRMRAAQAKVAGSKPSGARQLPPVDDVPPPSDNDAPWNARH